ncbi:MAG: PAAR domain-containing protein [Gemmatimonadetes bacterium]|nr:PAAR domain-containing protein [Gemmatimonadota bacterium]
MGQPAAKQGDQVVATDIHVVMIPAPSGAVPTPLPHPFVGKIDGSLSGDVNIEGKAAAVLGSTATNSPSHVPQGGSFQKPPADRGTIQKGSATVFINGKPAARSGDTVLTCNDPADAPTGSIVAAGTVLIGG